MNTIQIAEQVKEVIMKELFTDVNDKKCVLDLYIENGNKNSQQLSKVSQAFLDNKKSELAKEHDSGRILFFRKYNYEKILNQYLENKYSVANVEFDMFPSEKKQQELRKKQQKEVRKQNRRNEEEEILREISKLKWEKKIKNNTVIYKSVCGNGKTLELHYALGLTKNPKSYNRVLYDNHPLMYAKYDINKLIRMIEKTKLKKTQNKEATFNVEHKTSKKNSANSYEKTRQELVNQQAYKEKIQKISMDYKVDIRSVLEVIKQVQKACSYCKGTECIRLAQICTPYEKRCISYYRYLSKLLEKSKEQNMHLTESNETKSEKKIIPKGMEQKPLEIGLKDFVVRGNVFKCMRNKHKIDNIDALISIDDDGKRCKEKISAGFCSQCKVYFILDSTYEKLKKKGIILCRVTDEKNYMKGGTVNGMKLAQESLLMQYGYTVSQTEGLSATGRQKILAVIIDNKIMSKSEIISYLDFFISQRSSIPNMEVAISKWEADREFVENYKIGQYTQFGVKAIYRR